jgi:hypothetical protein
MWRVFRKIGLVLAVLGFCAMLLHEKSAETASDSKAWPANLILGGAPASPLIPSVHWEQTLPLPSRRNNSNTANSGDWAPLSASELRARCIPLKNARLTTRSNFLAGNFGVCADRFGITRQFNPGSVLLKIKGTDGTQLLPVEPGSESAAISSLEKRGDVLFAELDALMTRQFEPNDEFIGEQWHHQVIRSAEAWAIRADAHETRIAIVDTPFQMNHPDLAANTDPGWDVVNQTEIRSDPIGYFHSTIGAGMAAAVVNNSIGVAGAANARILPVNINGYLSEMYQAILWCADHQARVVNLSWDGAFSSTVNDAGAILRSSVDGMVVMSGVNTRKFLDYPNQPYITAISMTDSNDLSQSAYGRHIDFAAPGWRIYSSTTNSFYETDSGSSYSAPLACGIIASLMSINPDLSASDVEQILRASAVDTGPESWDQYYGWGRLDFGKAALMAASRLSFRRAGTNLEITVPFYPQVKLQLLEKSELGSAAPANAMPGSVRDGRVYFELAPLAAPFKFYTALGELLPELQPGI